MISGTGVYWANRGLLDLGNPNAFAETNGQRYLLEAIGLAPWLGSDLAGGGSSYLYGTNYFQVTTKGMTREWGYVGVAYGEMQFYAADFYSWASARSASVRSAAGSKSSTAARLLNFPQAAVGHFDCGFSLIIPPGEVYVIPIISNPLCNEPAAVVVGSG